MVLPYVASQLCGAVAASVLLKALFTRGNTLGVTLPSGTAAQSFVFETVLTCILMFVILTVSTGAKEKGAMAGSDIGAVIALEALFAGPVSGASMNPARSLGPALVSGKLGSVWIYIIAPPAGSTIAVAFARIVRYGTMKRPEDTF